MLCNSWVIVDRATGKPVFETYKRSTADKVNTQRYEVLTAYQWLVRVNNRALAREAINSILD